LIAKGVANEKETRRTTPGTTTKDRYIDRRSIGLV
jgi:hypothetical protein